MLNYDGLYNYGKFAPIKKMGRYAKKKAKERAQQPKKEWHPLEISEWLMTIGIL